MRDCSVRYQRALTIGALAAVATLVSFGSADAACSFTPPLTTETECLTAVQIPGNALRSFDISWVNAQRGEYYLADRSNAGIDIIDTKHNTFVRTIPGFVGIKLKGSNVNNAISGPDGIVSHGHWLYAGDGDSTLKVIDLDAPTTSAIKQTISTGGTTRVDEMALTGDGKLLLTANNAEDPPFATLFSANGDARSSNVTKSIPKITVASSILPAGFGLSLEQPAWEPKTQRFYVSIPVIKDNPTGCNYGQLAGAITCDGGLLVIDPTKTTTVYGAFDNTTNTGVVDLHACGPNGATVGPDSNLLLGCTPGNNPADRTTLVINAKTKNYANIANITGSDEVWFNPGDRRYYTGSSRNLDTSKTPPAPAPVLGVIDRTSVLIETVPQSSGSHSVAADCKRNFIYVPQVAPASLVGSGGDTTTNGVGICGSSKGCVAVYTHEHENASCGASDNNDQEGN